MLGILWRESNLALKEKKVSLVPVLDEEPHMDFYASLCPKWSMAEIRGDSSPL